MTGEVAVSTALLRGPDLTVTHRGPAGDDTRYEIGSLTKTFTVLLLGDLAARGAVSLDDPVNRHLPPGGRLRGEPGNRVTLRHLAGHTAGLPRLPRNLWPTALPRLRTEPYARYPAESLLRAAARQRIRVAPGSRWAYSTYGIGLLGLALARAAGDGWERLVADRIGTPLGLTATSGRHDPGADATGHDRRMRPVPPLRIPGLAAAGALRATVRDLVRYLNAWREPESTPLAPAVRVVAAAGLGWMPHPDRRVHSGGTPGFTAFAGWRGDTGIVMLTNVTPTRRHSIVREAAALLDSD